MAKNDKKEKKVPTTGYEWDGIKEYDNPLPRWWLWTWIATIIFSIIYVIIYPAWPLLNSFTEGTLGWSQYSQLDEEKNIAAEKQQVFNSQISMQSVHKINKDPQLANFAIAAGKAQFALSCSQCHGSGAQGFKGYPSLLDDEWIWGGELEDIIATITHGIRAEDDEGTRNNMMMAFGKEEMLTAREIADLARYIKVISADFLTNDSSDRGETVFAENCTTCHGENAEGLQEMGSPALNNAIWLYGGHTEDIIESITNGRAGQMPAFAKALSRDDIKKLALYVYSLGNDEGR